MELTQRLECTQELYSDCCEKTIPEQIGFLGICGTKHPLKKGPNKIGRDPESCNIVLNLNSISRQHAVINILNSRDFMLMDLDSANKTKLADKTLQPYIPYPLKNGDLVQFGEVFGVFRLLQEENDLPMTQAMDVIDTPVHNRHVSKLNIHATTIPESPEGSDKDDSYIAGSQQKPKNVFKNPNNNFLKSSGKTISIKPIGTNKIDNVFWSSSKKSDSFSMQSNLSGNLDDSLASPQNCRTNVDKQNIHEMDTQIPHPNTNDSIDSIYNATTQIVESSDDPNIFEMETQLPTAENLPDVCKIQEQENLQINFSTDDKENDNNIHNAETQITFNSKPVSPKENIHNAETQIALCVRPISPRVSENLTDKPKLSSPSNVSDDIILFDEIDNEPLQDDFESQQLLSPKLTENPVESDENIGESQDIHFIPQKRVNRIESDSSTDCEDIDIAATQKIPEIKNDDDVTDCEDEPIAILKTSKNQKNSPDIDEGVTDCEDNDRDITQTNKVEKNENFEVLPTQIVDDSKKDKEMINMDNKDDSFEDLPTQIIEENRSFESNRKQRTALPAAPTHVLNHESPKGTCFEEALTQQIYSEEVVKFKVPFQSPVKKKKKIDTSVKLNRISAPIEIIDDDDEKYYAATQELFDDLCSQRPLSPEVQIINNDENQSLKQITSFNRSFRSNSSESLDGEEKISDFVSNLTCSQIQDVVGVQKEVTVLKKMPSDGSDIVATPKKINCLSALEIDLPNTQEIKTGISLALNSDTESFTDNLSESEVDSKKSTPVKLKQKQKATNKIRINLSDKFDPESIPVRSSSRVRKPTSKIQNCDETFKDIAEKLLKPGTVNLQEVKKEKNDKHRKEKLIKSKTKIEDYYQASSSKSSEMDHNAKENSSSKKDTEKPKKNESKRGRKPKQKDETIDIKPKSKDTTLEELKANSHSSGRSTRSKQKEEEIRRNGTSSSSRRSKTPDKGKSRSDIKNKSNRKPSKERSKSPEKERKRKTTKETSRSPELKLRRNLKETSKSPEIGTRRKLTVEKSRTSGKERKRKTTKETSMSPELELRRNPKERSKSPKIGSGRKATVEKSRSSEKEMKRITTKKTSMSPELELRRNPKERSKSPEIGSGRKATVEKSRSSEKERKIKTTKDSEKSVQKVEETIEIRRSTRNKGKKLEEPIDVQVNVTTKSPKHGRSTVYSTINISSDSGTDSPNKLKRSPTCELDMPDSKKPKIVKNSQQSILRATPARKNRTQYVLFTAFPCDEVKNKLEELGAIVVSDVMTCTVVLTLQIKRTFKLLCAVGLGKPIVGPNWVQACADTKMIVDPWLYVIKDEAIEKRFKFNLQQMLVGKREFLEGYNVSSTPSVVPRAQEMKLIVECSGGRWAEEGPNWLCVSAPADSALWAGLRRRGAVVVSTELILCGVLSQRLEIEKCML